jgi:hypothetical protein
MTHQNDSCTDPLISSRRTLMQLAMLAAVAPVWAQTHSSANGDAPRLRHIGSSSLPHKLQFEGTTVGGLSGLDYDRAKDVFYAISDDRSQHAPARFYTLKLPISARALGPAQLLSVTSIRTPMGDMYPNASQVTPRNPQVPDPEGIRLRRDLGSLYWCSEGDTARGAGSFIREMRLDGSYASEISLPAMFLPTKEGKSGIRDNLGVEAFAFAPDEDTVWFTTENALIQDGAMPTLDKPGGPVRLTQLDIRSGALVRQLAYIPDAIPAAPKLAGISLPAASGLGADNGISEIWMASEAGMLVLERAWARGVGNSIRLYWVDLESGDDVSKRPALMNETFKPVDKVLLLDFAKAGIAQPDNVEGMTRGPNLIGADGKRGNPTLVFVSDDNFNSSQTTWFHAFEWLP